jgi:hypothetical protein
LFVLFRLALSENKLGIEGAKHIVTIAVDVDNFTSLSLSGTINYVSKYLSFKINHDMFQTAM